MTNWSHNRIISIMGWSALTARSACPLDVHKNLTLVHFVIIIMIIGSNHESDIPKWPECISLYHWICIVPRADIMSVRNIFSLFKPTTHQHCPLVKKHSLPMLTNPVQHCNLQVRFSEQIKPVWVCNITQPVHMVQVSIHFYIIFACDNTSLQCHNLWDKHVEWP